MKRHANTLKRVHFALVMAIMACIGFAQDDVIRLKYSEPSKPGFLTAKLIHGKFEVIGHDSDEITIEVSSDKRTHHKPRPHGDNPEGLRKVTGQSTALTVEEKDNRIKIIAKSHLRSVVLLIHVPRRTSLTLEAINDARIEVTGVTGEHDLTTINGGVIARDISGSLVGHALNDDLVVTFREINPNAAMAFSSMNGNVDITLPPSTRASLKLNTERGDIFTNFDLDLKPVVKKSERESEDGPYRIEFERTMAGELNGGGPEMSFRTMNGDILVRKGS